MITKNSKVWLLRTDGSHTYGVVQDIKDNMAFVTWTIQVPSFPGVLNSRIVTKTKGKWVKIISLLEVE